MLQSPPTRRALLSTLLACAPLSITECPALALAPPPPQISQLAAALASARTLAADLDAGAADSSVVLRTSAAVFSPASAVLRNLATARRLPQLEPAQLERAQALASSLEAQAIPALADAARRKDVEAERKAVEQLSSIFDDFIYTVAAAKYEVPPRAQQQVALSESENIARYFGFFSCEGQGLERIAGSNSCKNKNDETPPRVY